MRDDVYYYIATKFGKRSISKTINEFLVSHLFVERKKKDLYGSCKWLLKTGWKDLRDESDRDIG